eukprot:6192283-Pleurochrysis_carterae.AAC.1
MLIPRVLPRALDWAFALAMRSVLCARDGDSVWRIAFCRSPKSKRRALRLGLRPVWPARPRCGVGQMTLSAPRANDESAHAF